MESLVLKLLKPPINFGIQSMNICYKKCNLKEKFWLTKIQPEKVFKILKCFDETKALGIDDLSRTLLKDGATL